jgi:hypothetical protein
MTRKTDAWQDTHYINRMDTARKNARPAPQRGSGWIRALLGGVAVVGLVLAVLEWSI